jgi:hypothetical protein
MKHPLPSDLRCTQAIDRLIGRLAEKITPERDNVSHKGGICGKDYQLRCTVKAHCQCILSYS